LSEEHGGRFVVTPWEVEGKIDYDKLIREFGTQPITEQLLKRLEREAGGSHHMLRRKVFFSHRDLDLVLDDVRSGKGFFLYTGRGPTGPMHIGHIVPLYFSRWLQERFHANLYVQVTDDEKFLYEKRGLTLDETRKWSYDNILDIIAVGLDPDRTFIFQDTEYMGNMYPLAVKVARRINFSVTKAVFGFDEQTNVGMIFYPAIQVVPSLFERRRCLIPAAIDQDPYWRVQRDVAEPLGFYKTAAIHSKLIPPLTGPQGKMSTSAPETAIYLHDDDKAVKNKIMKYAFSGGQPTIELHRKLGGNPDVDVPFQWLYMFFEEDDAKLKEIESDYRSGKLLTGDLKGILVDKVCDFLQRHRERRRKAPELVDTYKREGKLARKMWSTVHE
jgi:tryptophanyl-tRNA synthetase